MVGAGVAIALPCVWWTGRFVQSQLYDMAPTDPLTIVIAALVVCGIALGSSLVPAQRAASIDPTEALRSP
jgi:ABC-type lipoprotein release transport system permease subunit